MSDEILDNVHAWCNFADDGTGSRGYVLMAIARKTHNPDVTNSKEIVHRRVLSERDDVERAVRDLWALTDADTDHVYRYYLTVNARNLHQAFYRFLQTQISWVGGAATDEGAAYDKMEHVSSEWKSEVHRPRNKCDSTFQIDFDEEDTDRRDELINALEEVTTVRWVAETPNGWHILTDPFEYPAWESPVEYDDLDTDGQLYVGRSPAE